MYTHTWYKCIYIDSPFSSNKTASSRRRCRPPRFRNTAPRSQRFRSWARGGIFARTPLGAPRNAGNGIDPVTGSKPTAVGRVPRHRSRGGSYRRRRGRANVSSTRRQPERRSPSCCNARHSTRHLPNRWTSPRGRPRTRTRRRSRTICLSPDDRPTGTCTVLRAERFVYGGGKKKRRK